MGVVVDKTRRAGPGIDGAACDNEIGRRRGGRGGEQDDTAPAAPGVNGEKAGTATLLAHHPTD